MTIEAAMQPLRARDVRVPRPMRLPTEEEIQNMAKLTGVSFPPDYRQELLSASDVVVGTLEPGTITDPGCHTCLPEIIVSARTSGVPDHLLPIIEDSADFYCLTHSGEVIFWSQNGSTTEKGRTLRRGFTRCG
jgi:hypothetical protein